MIGRLTLAAALALIVLSGLQAGAAGAPAPACFGAAARDAAAPCENPALRFAVRPTPEDAELQPNSSCVLTAAKGPPNRVCAFGTPKASARETVALLGDSHAPSWRAGVDVLARAQRWRGLTVRRSSCPFTTARRFTDQGSSEACFAWIQATLRFFGHHPEIHTVFLATSSAYEYRPAEGLDAHATAVAGFRAALDALPPSVRQVVVLRDNPIARDDTLGCVDAALARHRRADLRCALARDGSLLPDAAAEAATGLRADRGRVIDLSRTFCDDARCYPVIGGALVFKDKSHLTTTFSRTLGPLLVRGYRALSPPVPVRTASAPPAPASSRAAWAP